MSDRSVTAHEMSQTVVVTGDHNQVTLAFGATGVSLPLARRQFRPLRRRALTELDMLMPDAGALPFVGRGDMMAELRGWLDAEADISVHALVGRAGTGKTRLAIELSRAIDPEPASTRILARGFSASGRDGRGGGHASNQ
jgi:hypothetical protein